MADSFFKATFKPVLRAIFGARETSTGDVDTSVKQLVTKRITHAWPRRVGGGITNHLFNSIGHTASKSLSQPSAERVIYTADRECVVASAYFSPHVSSTVSASASMAWTLLINKRGGGINTLSVSQTVSVSAAICGLTSCTKKDGDTTISVSILGRNLANFPNRIGITGTTAKKRLKRGDQLVARVRKGRVGHADDTGAWWPGGELVVNVEED